MKTHPSSSAAGIVVLLELEPVERFMLVVVVLYECKFSGFSSAFDLVLSLDTPSEKKKRLKNGQFLRENIKREKMNQSSLPAFFTISFGRKSNALSFATNKGQKEKCFCIILSVLEHLSGKNYNARFYFRSC